MHLKGQRSKVKLWGKTNTLLTTHGVQIAALYPWNANLQVVFYCTRYRSLRAKQMFTGRDSSCRIRRQL